MKETVGSLRAYFFIVSILGGISSLLLLTGLVASLTGLGIALMLATICLAAAYLYLAIGFKRLIVEAPERVRTIIMFGGVMVASVLVLNLIQGSVQGMIQGAFGLLIVWYLLGNTARLSAEAVEAARATQQGNQV